jgi:hypothetical protein
MITFSPRSVTVHEDDVLSVVSFNVQLREQDAETVIGTKNVPADPSGDTLIPISDMLDVSKVGTVVRVYLQEVGPTETTPYVPVSNGNEEFDFTVREVPDGAESAVVNL